MYEPKASERWSSRPCDGEFTSIATQASLSKAKRSWPSTEKRRFWWISQTCAAMRGGSLVEGEGDREKGGKGSFCVCFGRNRKGWRCSLAF